MDRMTSWVTGVSQSAHQGTRRHSVTAVSAAIGYVPLLQVFRRTDIGKRSFSWAAPATWNSLPHVVINCDTRSVFKSRLKLRQCGALPMYFLLQRYGNLKFSKWPPAAILDLIRPEMAPFDPPSRKTPPWNQTWRGSDDALLSYGHLKSSRVWIGPEVGRSVSGRSSISSSSSSSSFNLKQCQYIHTSYTDVRYSSLAKLGA